PQDAPSVQLVGAVAFGQLVVGSAAHSGDLELADHARGQNAAETARHEQVGLDAVHLVDVYPLRAHRCGELLLIQVHVRHGEPCARLRECRREATPDLAETGDHQVAPRDIAVAVDGVEGGQDACVHAGC